MTLAIMTINVMMAGLAIYIATGIDPFQSTLYGALLMGLTLQPDEKPRDTFRYAEMAEQRFWTVLSTLAMVSLIKAIEVTVEAL